MLVQSFPENFDRCRINRMAGDPVPPVDQSLTDETQTVFLANTLVDFVVMSSELGSSRHC